MVRQVKNSVYIAKYIAKKIKSVYFKISIKKVSSAVSDNGSAVGPCRRHTELAYVMNRLKTKCTHRWMDGSETNQSGRI